MASWFSFSRRSAKLACAGLLGLALSFSPVTVGAQHLPQSDGSTEQADAGDIPDPEAALLGQWERFVYDRTSRMTVPVHINGTEAVPFIVDTGSEQTVISRQLAERLGLPISRSLRLATVSGEVTAASYRIDHLSNGGFEDSDFDAPALERRHMGIDGLIGIESLRDKTVVFDFANQQLQIYTQDESPPTSQPNDGETIIVTARRRSGRLVVSDAEVYGRRVSLVIDTGSQSSVGNRALQRLVRLRSRAQVAPAEIIDVVGVSIMGQASVIDNIKIGNFAVTDLPITYADSYALDHLGLGKRPAMLLGMDALSLFDRVEINFPRRRIKFVMPGSASRSVRERPARMATRI